MKKIKTAGMSKEALTKANSELKKLKLMSPMSAEATVVRNYIETLIGLPWRKNRASARTLLQQRKFSTATILVLKRSRNALSSTWRCERRVEKVKAPIFCVWSALPVRQDLTRQSIAKATNRKFIRWPWAASAMRPRFAVTAGPTLVRCRARSCRTWPNRASKIHCSCSTKSTRWAWYSG